MKKKIIFGVCLFASLLILAAASAYVIVRTNPGMVVGQLSQLDASKAYKARQLQSEGKWVEFKDYDFTALMPKGQTDLTIPEYKSYSKVVGVKSSTGSPRSCTGILTIPDKDFNTSMFSDGTSPTELLKSVLPTYEETVKKLFGNEQISHAFDISTTTLKSGEKAVNIDGETLLINAVKDADGSPTGEAKTDKVKLSSKLVLRDGRPFYVWALTTSEEESDKLEQSEQTDISASSFISLRV